MRSENIILVKITLLAVQPFAQLTTPNAANGDNYVKNEDISVSVHGNDTRGVLN